MKYHSRHALNQQRAAQPLTAVPSPCLKVLYIVNCRQKYFTIKVTSHKISKSIYFCLLNTSFKHLCKTVHSNKWNVFSIMSQRGGDVIIFYFWITHKLEGGDHLFFLMALKVNLEDTMYCLIILIKEKRFLIQTYLIYN